MAEWSERQNRNLVVLRLSSALTTTWICFLVAQVQILSHTSFVGSQLVMMLCLAKIHRQFLSDFTNNDWFLASLHCSNNNNNNNFYYDLHICNLNGLNSEMSVVHAFNVAVHQANFKERLFACWHFNNQNVNTFFQFTLSLNNKNL